MRVFGDYELTYRPALRCRVVTLYNELMIVGHAGGAMHSISNDIQSLGEWAAPGNDGGVWEATQKLTAVRVVLAQREQTYNVGERSRYITKLLESYKGITLQIEGGEDGLLQAIHVALTALVECERAIEDKRAARQVVRRSMKMLMECRTLADVTVSWARIVKGAEGQLAVSCGTTGGERRDRAGKYYTGDLLSNKTAAIHASRALRGWVPGAGPGQGKVELLVVRASEIISEHKAFYLLACGWTGKLPQEKGTDEAEMQRQTIAGYRDGMLRAVGRADAIRWGDELNRLMGVEGKMPNEHHIEAMLGRLVDADPEGTKRLLEYIVENRGAPESGTEPERFMPG